MLYLDIETTGLDPYCHAIVELSYAINNDDPFTLVFPHSLNGADPKALEVNKYYERGLNDQRKFATIEQINSLHTILHDQVIAGSNPAFDTAFLKEYGYSGWKHRLMDVPLWAAGRLGWPESKGLYRTAQFLIDGMNMDIPLPDHTAEGDIRCTRAIYTSLLLSRNMALEARMPA